MAADCVWIDPGLLDAFASLAPMSPLSVERFAEIRERTASGALTDDQICDGGVRQVQEHLVRRRHSVGSVRGLTVRRSSEPERSRMCVVYIHGGGMVSGSYRTSGLERMLPLVDQLDAVVVSVDYRLAPEFPFPAGLDDCRDVLAWVHQNADELSVDRKRVVVAGISSGGAIAAGLALLARDSGGPAIAAQLLLSPMLDDRFGDDAIFLLEGRGVWDMASNRVGWSAYIGDSAEEAGVSPYAAPSRALELAGLPPTFIDTGSADLFLEEDLAFARRLMMAGVPVELHVWPGAFHGSEPMLPGADLSLAARQCRIAYLKRTLA